MAKKGKKGKKGKTRKARKKSSFGALPKLRRKRLSGETIEPRILLSATWIDGTVDPDSIDGTGGEDGSADGNALPDLLVDDLVPAPIDAPDVSCRGPSHRR